jgi:hypothetical protein
MAMNAANITRETTYSSKELCLKDLCLKDLTAIASVLHSKVNGNYKYHTGIGTKSQGMLAMCQPVDIDGKPMPPGIENPAVPKMT